MLLKNIYRSLMENDRIYLRYDIFLTFFLISYSVVSEESSTCRTPVSNFVVHCQVSSWYPSLLSDHRINKTAVRFLQIKFIHQVPQLKLTREDLAGLDNLESLVLVGRCVIGHVWCRNPTGLTTIEIDAFNATPRLKALRLRTLPLRSVSAISALRNLETIEFRWLFPITNLPSSIFDNMRSSLRRLLIRYVPIREITDRLLKGMTKLETLEVNTLAPTLIIRAHGISNLPRLKSIMIAIVEMFGPQAMLKLGNSAISNVSSLEFVSLHMIPRVEGPLNQACSGDFNIVSMSLTDAIVSIFDYCPQFLTCIKCGQNPERYPQTIIIEQPMPSVRKPKFRIFPPRDIIPEFNVTSLFIHHSDFPYPFEMLSQMPLLEKFFIELNNVHGHMKHKRIARFKNNPFALLPKRTRLNEIRVSLRHCDCQLFEIINWFRNNRRYDSDKYLDDILKVDCLIVDGICSDEEKGRSRLFVNWMNISLLASKLKSFCPATPNHNAIYRQVPSSECRCLNLEKCANSAPKILPVVTLLTCISLLITIM